MASEPCPSHRCLLGDTFQGPFSRAISRRKRALLYPARMLFREASRGLNHIFDNTPLSNLCQLGSISSQSCNTTKNPCGVGWGRLCAQNRISHVQTGLYSHSARDLYPVHGRVRLILVVMETVIISHLVRHFARRRTRFHRLT